MPSPRVEGYGPSSSSPAEREKEGRKDSRTTDSVLVGWIPTIADVTNSWIRVSRRETGSSTFQPRILRPCLGSRLTSESPPRSREKRGPEVGHTLNEGNFGFRLAPLFAPRSESWKRGNRVPQRRGGCARSHTSSTRHQQPVDIPCNRGTGGVKLWRSRPF